jgi:hypothetical protein
MNIREAKIEALRHAASLCETRKAGRKTPDYIAACDDIKLMIEAAISRVEAGGEMHATAVCQSEAGKAGG